MKLLTQTKENCWQTCVAMLLDVDPESLPDQVEISGKDPYRYSEVLRAYLYKHWNMTYFEVGEEDWANLGKQPNVAHVMMGETIRTPENGVWHAIVGISGVPYWDVHPSRAGLTKVHKWGIFTPFPEHWREGWQQRVEAGDEKLRCLCRDCAHIKELL